MSIKIQGQPEVAKISSKQAAPVEKGQQKIVDKIDSLASEKMAPSTKESSSKGFCEKVKDFFSAIWNWFVKLITCRLCKKETPASETATVPSSKTEPKKDDKTQTITNAATTAPSATDTKKADGTKDKDEKKGTKQESKQNQDPSSTSKQQTAEDTKKQDKAQSATVTQPLQPLSVSKDKAQSATVTQPASISKPATPITYSGMTKEKIVYSSGVPTNSIGATFSQMFTPPLLSREDAAKKDFRGSLHVLGGLTLGIEYLPSDAARKEVFESMKAKLGYKSMSYHHNEQAGQAFIAIDDLRESLTFLGKECQFSAKYIAGLIKFEERYALDDTNYKKGIAVLKELHKEGIVKGELPEDLNKKEEPKKAPTSTPDQSKTAAEQDKKLGSQTIINASQPQTVKPVAYVGLKDKRIIKAGVGSSLGATFTQMFEPPLQPKKEADMHQSYRVDLTAGGMTIFVQYAPEKAEDAFKALKASIAFTTLSFNKDDSSITIKDPKEYLTFMGRDCHFTAQDLVELLNARKNKGLDEQAYKIALDQLRELHKAGIVKGKTPEELADKKEENKDVPSPAKNPPPAPTHQEPKIAGSQTAPAKKPSLAAYTGMTKAKMIYKDGMGSSIGATFTQMFEPPLQTRENAIKQPFHKVELSASFGLSIKIEYIANQPQRDDAFLSIKAALGYKSMYMSFGGKGISIADPREYLTFLGKDCLFTSQDIVDFLNARRDAGHISPVVYQQVLAVLKELRQAGIVESKTMPEELKEKKVESKETAPAKKTVQQAPAPKMENKEQEAPASVKLVFNDDQIRKTFAAIDSSALVKLPGDKAIRGRPDFKAQNWNPIPPVISRSSFVSDEMVTHLMRNKKNTAIGVKWQDGRGDQITNMEAALHTFVTPVCAINMLGDFQWKGVADGKLFGDNQVRPAIMSAAIHPDFENREVVYALIKAEKDEVVGQDKKDLAILSKDDKQNAAKRNAYDQEVRRHMIYHLRADHKLPAVSQIKQQNIFDMKGALKLLTLCLQKDEEPNIQDKFLKVGNDLLSLEMLFNMYRHQIRNEFTALNEYAPQGFIYTIDPPRIFAQELGGAQILNRLQALAFRSLRAEGIFTNLKQIAFNTHSDPEMVALYQKAMPANIKITPKQAQDAEEALFNKDGKLNAIPKGWVVVWHNNSDGLGQNIEFEGVSSMDGLLGNYSDASRVLRRDRPDLLICVITPQAK